MSERCIEASRARELARGPERLRSHARQIFIDAAITDGVVIAPQLFIYEVDSIIRASEQSGLLSARDAQLAYADLDRLDIIIDSPDVRRRAREIARQFGQQRV